MKLLPKWYKFTTQEKIQCIDKLVQMWKIDTKQANILIKLNS